MCKLLNNFFCSEDPDRIESAITWGWSFLGESNGRATVGILVTGGEDDHVRFHS